MTKHISLPKKAFLLSFSTNKVFGPTVLRSSFKEDSNGREEMRFLSMNEDLSTVGRNTLLIKNNKKKPFRQGEVRVHLWPYFKILVKLLIRVNCNDMLLPKTCYN